MRENFRGWARRRAGASGLRLLLRVPCANNVTEEATGQAIERTPFATGWRVLELGHVLFHQTDILELALLHDLLFDVRRTGAGHGFYVVFGPAPQPLPSVFRQVFHDFI